MRGTGRAAPPGVLAEQAFERRAEVAGREALEVQDRDHPTFGERRAYAGRIRELNFCRSPSWTSSEEQRSHASDRGRPHRADPSGCRRVGFVSS
jgi:hypothetical protein